MAEGEIKEFFDGVLEGRLTDDRVKTVLEEMFSRGETVEEIVTAVRSMEDHMIKIFPKVDKNLLDIVGTGGDGKNFLNISTISSFVAAGAGCYVAKHCNRGFTSKVGSADMLEALGVNVNFESKETEKLIGDIGIGFMFAPIYHPSMKNVSDIRRRINHRTIFNLLGPLTNPANAQTRLIGACDYRTAEKLAEASRRLGIDRVFLVYGEDGLDEVSISGTTRVVSLGEHSKGKVFRYSLNPETYGFKGILSDLVVKSAEESAKICVRILSERDLKGELNVMRDIVIFNSGVAIYVNGRCSSFEEGIEMARSSIESGSAKYKLDQIVDYSGKHL